MGGREDYDDESAAAAVVAEGAKPAWLEALLAETFFAACEDHQNRARNEVNIFCLDCCQSFCPHCLPSHTAHRMLQVRRYLYHDVVRMEDLERLIDCASIKPYTINRSKVMFLNQRAQSKPGKGSANACVVCDRILQEPFSFCSLSCKVDYMVYQGEDLSSILCKVDESDFAVSQFEMLRMDCPDLVCDEGEITPNSILENPLSCRGSTCSYDTSMGSSAISMQEEMVDNSKKKKKKKSSGFLPGIMLSLSNRRKGAPQRSPLS